MNAKKVDHYLFRMNGISKRLAIYKNAFIYSSMGGQFVHPITRHWLFKTRPVTPTLDHSKQLAILRKDIAIQRQLMWGAGSMFIASPISQEILNTQLSSPSFWFVLFLITWRNQRVTTNMVEALEKDPTLGDAIAKLGGFQHQVSIQEFLYGEKHKRSDPGESDH